MAKLLKNVSTNGKYDGDLDSPPVDRVLAALEAHDCAYALAGGVYNAHCPAHDDSKASLRVSEGDGGRALLFCHAGCSFHDVVEALGLHPADLFAKPARKSGPRTVEYRYVDADGEVVAVKVRTNRKDGSKDFEWHRPDGTPGLNGTPTHDLPLYRLPELLAADPSTPVIFVEGEKACDALIDRAFVAVSLGGGAGQKKFSPSVFEPLKGRTVHVWPDNDAAGRKYADLVGGVLEEVGAEVRRLEVPGLPDKGDAFDFFAQGRTAEELTGLLNGEPKPAPLVEAAIRVNAADTTVQDTSHDPPGVDQSEAGNAKLFAHFNRGELLWVERWRTWLHYDGKRWARDEDGEAVRRAIDLTRTLLIRAAMITDAAEQRKAIKHAMTSRSAKSIKATLELARAMPGMSAAPDAFDADLDLLNCENGTLHLPTRTLRPHRPGDRITKLVTASYKEGTGADRWLTFWEEILPDEGVRSFLQRALGSALIGKNPDHAFYVLYSPTGRSGRSVFCEVILRVLGEYGASTDANTFMEVPRSGQNRDDLADLMGVRYVSASETKSDRKLDIDVVKWITGADTITTMRKYEHQFSYKPAFTIFLRTNHKPAISEANDPIWERVHLVPFTVHIPKAKRDLGLEEKLLKEKDGVLAWLVEGYRAWAEAGLNPPKAVVAATAEYQQESDLIGAFVEARLEHDPFAPSTKGERTTVVRTAYETWCRKNDAELLTRPVFNEKMRAKGFAQGNDREGNSIWRGVALRQMPPDYYRGGADD